MQPDGCTKTSVRDANNDGKRAPIPGPGARNLLRTRDFDDSLVGRLSHRNCNRDLVDQGPPWFGRRCRQRPPHNECASEQQYTNKMTADRHVAPNWQCGFRSQRHNYSKPMPPGAICLFNGGFVNFSVALTAKSPLISALQNVGIGPWRTCAAMQEYPLSGYSGH
jgi:hypothetical protein